MSDINTKTRSAIETARTNLDTSSKATGDAGVLVGQLLAPLTTARDALTGIQAELTSADPKSVEANALVAASHDVCDRLDAQRDALIALVEAGLTALVGGIEARQAAKDLHVILAEIEVAKAKGEDVFGLAAKLRDFKGLVPAKAGKK